MDWRSRYTISDIALGSAHTNPHIMRTPAGHWLLFSQATCATDQYPPTYLANLLRYCG
eukprot:COSAG05_NODE_156_length_15696_cov_359.955440_23_plen_58_part_00